MLLERRSRHDHLLGSVRWWTSRSRAAGACESIDLIGNRGRLKMIVSGNGTELTSNAVLALSGDVDREWQCIASGKPTQSGFVESFNDRMRRTA